MPPDRDYVAQGGVSHGEMCDWCGEDVSPQCAMIEIIWINPGPVLATAFLHPACYETWRAAQFPTA